MKTTREKIEVMEAWERGEKIEIYVVEWVPFDEEEPEWNWGKCKYRIAPKTITINGEEVPEPVSGIIERGRSYYYPSTVAAYVGVVYWSATEAQLQLLNNGLLHKTQEAAQAHLDALLKPTRRDK